MKKKLHKTGTTILLALAPAAALGITAGIVVSSLGQNQSELDQYIDKYTKFFNRCQSDLNNSVAYDSDDVSNGNIVYKATASVGEVILTGVSIGDYKDYMALYASTQAGPFVSLPAPITMDVTPSQQRVRLEEKAKTNKLEYVISDDEISFSEIDGDGNIITKECHNKFGYYTYWMGEDELETTITYKIDPHTVS